MSDTNNMAEIVSEAVEEVGAEMTATQLLEGEGAEDAQATEQQAAEAEAEGAAEQPAEDGRKEQYATALREMVQYGGWTRDEIDAMVKDETVLKDLTAGNSLWAAASAYRNRTAPAQSAKPAKRAVPTVRKASADTRPDEDDISAKINRMSSAEFAQLSEKAVAEAMSGKRVSIK